jgi:hypothetical protein
MCTILPLPKQQRPCVNVNIDSVTRKRTNHDAFTTTTKIGVSNVAAEQLLTMVASAARKRPRSCFQQHQQYHEKKSIFLPATEATSAATPLPPAFPRGVSINHNRQIHIIPPKKTVMFADQVEENSNDDDSSSSSFGRSSEHDNDDDDENIISIIDHVLGNITSSKLQHRDVKVEQQHDDDTEGVITDKTTTASTWYDRDELRAFQVEARNQVLADLARRVVAHKSRKNSKSGVVSYSSSKTLKFLEEAAGKAASASASAATTTTTRGLERFDVFRAREKSAARKIVLLAWQQKMGGDEIASIAHRCSVRAVQDAIVLAEQDFKEVYQQFHC